MSELKRLRSTQLVLSLSAVIFGLWGLWLARHGSFTDSHGAETGWAKYEFRLMTYNKLGAITTVALGALGLLIAFIKKPKFGWILAIGFAAYLIQALVQWRDTGSNILGSGGVALAFALTMTVGFGLMAGLSDFVAD